MLICWILSRARRHELALTRSVAGAGDGGNDVSWLSEVGLSAAVAATLAELQLNEKCIKAFATIALKQNEPGIEEACKQFKAKKVIIPDAMVQMVQSRFDGSDFVFKTTGLYAVSEPCGYIASSFGKCLLEKRKMNGITLSVWLPEK